MEPDKAVFRKPPLTALATVFMAGTVALHIYTVCSQPKVWQLYFAALVFAGFEYLFWLMGWHSAIRISSDMLIVDNALLRHRMPLSDVSVRVEDGLQVIAADGVRIGSVSFGGSTIGSMRGYRYTRRVADKINAEIAQRRAKETNPENLPERRTRFYVPWMPLIGFVGIFEVIVFVASLFG